MDDILQELLAQGQSIWYDNIRRALLTSGELERLIERGVRGVTSNPSIFEKAIAGSTDYDDELRSLAAGGLSPPEIYERMALADIRRAADLLQGVYEQSGGLDGYVSLEVNPGLANDTEGTVEEGRRLHAEVDRPNVMIKVPATKAGLAAIRRLIAAGISVNATLVFARDRYQAVGQAYLAGVEDLLESGGDLSRVASVASFFISRVDSAVDPLLRATGAEQLRGRIAIANAKLAYERFRDLFSGERWDRLAAAGARVQRPLWASTSTKDPQYSDTLYVDSLVGPDTVNTVPPSTLRALMVGGASEPTLDSGLVEARTDLEWLASLEIDLGEVTRELEREGVRAFAEAHDRLLASLEGKLQRLQAGPAPDLIGEAGGEEVVSALAEIEDGRIIERIWSHDHTVWSEDPAEITNRLGWLEMPGKMAAEVENLTRFAEEMWNAGLREVVLLGMGGSSLAPEVFRRIFGVGEKGLDLRVLDSTDPGVVQRIQDRVNLEKTLFIVATKSGSTVETLSFFKYFYNQVSSMVGPAAAGDHFIAITDPDSKLVALAQRHGFRKTFLNDPNIGGRYSALSYFGLVPAALVGVDLDKLLHRASEASCASESCVPCSENPAARIGSAIAELAKAGKDKLTFLISPEIEAFGDWVEQLIAESTGKAGAGILPVVGEPPGDPEVYGPDRLFVYLKMQGDHSLEAQINRLKEGGYPLIQLDLRDRYDLGAQMFLWEMATALAGHRLGIHPFNQPNVESAKVRAREMVEAYQQQGALPEEEPFLAEAGLTAYWGSPLDGQQTESDLLTVNDLISALWASGQAGSYLALHAYLAPSEEVDGSLRELQVLLRNRTKWAVTVGYGPRFLHSTGQLHKGDAGNGIFLQLTTDPASDVPIPARAGEPASEITFGALKLAQALGDRRALAEAGRTVAQIDLGEPAEDGLQRLLQAVQG